MKIAVWDTYVTKDDGTLMHFDIFVPDTLKDEVKIFNFGKEYLKSKNLENATLSSNECRFCHIEQAPEQIIKTIEEKGYYIYEMENCN